MEIIEERKFINKNDLFCSLDLEKLSKDETFNTVLEAWCCLREHPAVTFYTEKREKLFIEGM